MAPTTGPQIVHVPALQLQHLLQRHLRTVKVVITVAGSLPARAPRGPRAPR